MSFEEIIGNEENKSILTKTVRSVNILHSYLFYGVSGIGKKIFAKEFAKMILCNNKDSSIPCNKCDSCVKFDSGNNPDFFMVEPEGNSIKIEQIRNMQKNIQEKPIESSKKVYIIDDADTMTKEAQNCILKTLEEPQEYVVIILIASNENNILPTVKSRCMKMYFKELSKSELNTYIEKNYNSESIDENIYKLSNGSISNAEAIIKKSGVLDCTRSIVEDIRKINKLGFLQKNEFFLENKDDIFLILDYMYIVLYESLKNNVSNLNKTYKCMDIIENTKHKISNSNNFDMTIDSMLLNIWEEFNEKNSRG